MPTSFCAGCYLKSYCRRLQSRVVTGDELTSRFVADVRAHMRAMSLTRDQWKPFLIDAYQAYPGRIVDDEGSEVMLDTSVFDVASISYWFRDLCRPIPAGALPRLRRSAKPRFRVMASILRAVYPVPAMLWSKEIANDRDEPAFPKQPATADRCPYTDPARVSVVILKPGRLT